MFQYENNEVFNLWHDQELVELLERYFPPGLDGLSGGYLEFSAEQLEEARKEAKQDETREILDQMIEHARAYEDGYARCWCF